MGRPRYLEDEGGPRPGSHLRGAPPARPPPPRPKSNRTLPEPRRAGRGARGRSPGRRSRHPEPGSVPGAAARRDARRKGTESSSLVQKWRREESLPLRKRGRGGRGRGARAGRRDAGDAGAPGSGRSCAQTEPGPALGAPKRGPAAGKGGGEEGRGERGGRGGGGGGRGGGGGLGGGGGRASGGRRHPFIPPSKGTPAHTHTPTHIHNNACDATPGGDLPPLRPRRSRHLQKSLGRAPRHPLGRGPGRRARGAARPSPPERWAPGPPLPSAPARRAPRNSRPANFKGPPAHQSARAARPPRPRHLPLIRARAPRRDLAGAPGRAPAPAPGSARSGGPGPPRPGPGVGEHRESRGRGGGCGETTIPGLEQDPPGGRVKRRAPPPLLCKRPEWASAPAAAAPGPSGPSGPRPARLSTQVLFPAVTPRTKCPPGASNKNCAVDLTVHFKGASRAHGPEREVRAGRAPGRPPVPLPPLPRAVRLAPPHRARARPGRTPSRPGRPRRGSARPRPPSKGGFL